MLIIIAAVVFGFSFMTKARLGISGLALCAGALISQTLSSSTTGLVESLGFTSVSPPISLIVASGLVVVPAVLAMFSKIKYRVSLKKTIIAGVIASLFAVVLLSKQLIAAGNLDPISAQILGFVRDYDVIIIGIVVAYSLYDLLKFKFPKAKKKGRRRSSSVS